MSADLLRRAAELMRGRAEAATIGNGEVWQAVGWSEDGLGYQVFIGSDRHAPVATAYGNVLAATHLASWHPSVALAVADWLANMAVDIDEGLWPDPHDVVRDALAVARAYLVEQS